MNTKKSKKQLREFGFLFSFLLIFFIGLIIPVIFGHSFRAWTLWVGAPIIIISVIHPNSLQLPYIAWIKLGNILGWVNSHIILSIIFIFVLLPIALLMRINGYNPLYKKLSNKNSFKENTENNSVNFERIF